MADEQVAKKKNDYHQEQKILTIILFIIIIHTLIKLIKLIK